VTVFLTTQYLEEADRLADRIALLHQGQIVAEGTAAELKRQIAGQRLDLTLYDPASFAQMCLTLGDRALHADPDQLTISVPTDGTAAHIRALLDEIDPGRASIAHFAVHNATLDDVFLTLTGHAAGQSTQEIAHV
jgi:ABC-2 type transport system ATP-binding protein